MPPIRERKRLSGRMRAIINHIWHHFIQPLVRRPDFIQVGAYCWRDNDGTREILLVTSSNKNWIIPKGWPIEGMDCAGAAMVEAWEEAGVQTIHSNVRFLGMYNGRKEMFEGVYVNTHTHVYEIKADILKDDYPEKDSRERRWIKASDAAKIVSDPYMAAFLDQQKTLQDV